MIVTFWIAVFCLYTTAAAYMAVTRPSVMYVVLAMLGSAVLGILLFVKYLERP